MYLEGAVHLRADNDWQTRGPTAQPGPHRGQCGRAWPVATDGAPQVGDTPHPVGGEHALSSIGVSLPAESSLPPSPPWPGLLLHAGHPAPSQFVVPSSRDPAGQILKVLLHLPGVGGEGGRQRGPPKGSQAVAPSDTSSSRGVTQAPTPHRAGPRICQAAPGVHASTRDSGEPTCEGHQGPPTALFTCLPGPHLVGQLLSPLGWLRRPHLVAQLLGPPPCSPVPQSPTL